MRVEIHCEPAIGWQEPFAKKFAAGCKKLGIDWRITNSRVRTGWGRPVLLGTTFWQQIERDGGEYLLVDRCQFNDTNKWVTLGWNGHGREADFKVPKHYGPERWNRYGCELQPWRSGKYIVLCGQIPHPYSWYEEVVEYCDAFRVHPADGKNPTHLPGIQRWDEVGKAVTYASTVSNWTVMNGIPTVAMNQRSMSWDVCSHHPTETTICDRLEWCHWLAWTQWSHDEIADGVPHIWD